MEENENVEEVQNTESTEEQVVEQESPVSYKDDGTIVLDMNMVNKLEASNSENTTQEEVVTEEAPTVEDATNQVVEQAVEEEVQEVAEVAEAAIEQAEQTGRPLPENIEKLVDFINETGGSVEDYVKLNRNYSEMDNAEALAEYYKQTKPHLDAEERQFLMDQSFSYDEEVDEEADIRRKKIALKEQVAEAKAYLDGQKSKYYEEIKNTPSGQYKEAMDFFNRYNKETEENRRLAEERSEYFTEKTDNVFNDKFKGFEYEVGEQKLRYEIKDANKVKESQSDLNNFINRFVGKDGKITDAEGYHKALFAAMNTDAIAQHFYEQGRADALKNSIASSKNIDMSARGAEGTVANPGGIKVRALDLDTTPSFKFKKRK